MGWPPKAGEVLPRAAEAFGVREKLIGYSLDVDHRIGGSKARGFERILGISAGDVEYLTGAIESGVLQVAVSDVRGNAPYGVICEVRILIRGLGSKSSRVAVVITAWELTDAEAAPRLVSAYITD